MVAVRDQNGVAVSGTEVTAEITLPSGMTRTRSSTTGATGRAMFLAASKMGGTWQVCVTDIVKAGFTYDPNQNSETCDSIVYP